MMTDVQFTHLVECYADTIFRIAYNYLKCAADADDVTQTVFEKLLKQTRSFESQEHIKNWMIRVTINECRKLLRSPWRKTENFEDYARTISFENPKNGDLFRAVMELPKKYRLAIYLHYYEGYSTDEIAALLKIPKNTVCTHLRRGRELLKQTLQEVDIDV